MGAHIFTFLTLIAGGVMLADIIKNGNNSVAVINSVGGLWKTGVNGLLGQAS